jgi:hypothetical protein
MTDPPLIGVGVWLIAGLRGARLFHWIQDIYPELAAVLSGQFWLRAIQPVRNLAWRRAECCGTLGSGMAAVVANAGVSAESIAVIPNWAPSGLEPSDDEATAELRREWGLGGRFIVEYSGNLGRVYDHPVLAVARELRSDPRTLILVVGSGARRRALEAAAERECLSNIQFAGPNLAGKLSQTLSAGHVHLVTLRRGCERYVFPSKLQGILAVGRPGIFIGPVDCEVARIVTDQVLGRAFEREIHGHRASHHSPRGPPREAGRDGGKRPTIRAGIRRTPRCRRSMAAIAGAARSLPALIRSPQLRPG